MAILQALTMAQIGTSIHFLQEMKESNITDINSVLTRLEAERTRRRSEMLIVSQDHQSQVVIEMCPDCQIPMRRYDLDIVVFECRKCFLSYPEAIDDLG